MNLEKEIKKLNAFYDIENKGVYEFSFNPSQTTAETADYINKNFDKMDEVEMRKLMAHITDIKTVKRELLKYEIKYLKNCTPTSLNLKQFENKAVKILNRYQHKAGGFRLEDRTWLIHRSTSTEHTVLNNELLFENTLNDRDYDDVDTNLYLKFLTEQLQSLTTNISVELRFKEPEKGHMISVMIWCTDKNVEAGPEISL